MTHPRESSLHLRLYTRENCPLCDEMKEQLDRARLASASLERVDIDRDAAAHERFRFRIPVLEIQGRVAFEGRCEARQIVEYVRALEREPEAR